jgi:catechol 2,3-dioxygenase-like lactoylglutathione lyase family enzyme
MILDHITLPVSDFAAAKAFYERALAPLGITVLLEFPGACGFGRDGKPAFWIGVGPLSFWKEGQRAGTPTHIAFAAPDHATVDAFYAAAIAAGGRDYGAPGPRPQYHPGYYGAFVLDPEGNNIEAVCHT